MEHLVVDEFSAISGEHSPALDLLQAESTSGFPSLVFYRGPNKTHRPLESAFRIVLRMSYERRVPTCRLELNSATLCTQIVMFRACHSGQSPEAGSGHKDLNCGSWDWEVRVTVLLF